MGQFTGKAVIEFHTDQHAQDAVKKFNNMAVDDMVNLVTPVFDKEEVPTRLNTTLLAKRVYLMNVPYDAHKYEIENLVKEFAPVEEVVVPRDPKGYARGYAFVYLKNASDV